MPRLRLSPEVRHGQILDAALNVAAKVGYQRMTRDQIAAAAGASPAAINQRFSTMTMLRRDVMRAAIARGVVAVVAQGLADGNAYAKKASTELKQQAAALLCK